VFPENSRRRGRDQARRARIAEPRPGDHHINFSLSTVEQMGVINVVIYPLELRSETDQTAKCRQKFCSVSVVGFVFRPQNSAAGSPGARTDGYLQN
jgi:hypothetical protein